MSTRLTSGLALWISLALGLTAAGCLDRDLAPAEPSTQSGVLEQIRQTGITKVDILFVVDNSNSMGEEQGVLREQIRLLAEELISPSLEGAPAVQDLHIGIVTTDLGTGGYAIQTCDNPSSGDNGVLQNGGNLDGCASTYSAVDCDRGECPWLVHSLAHPDNAAEDPGNPPIWDDFGCIATLGTGGCGFEQQLEASYQALVVQTEPGRPNEGFLRDDSLLAIIYVTDEDDCSTPNGEFFNPNRDDFGPANVRCGLDQNEDQLYPISRYHDAFLALRQGNVDQVVVAAITGVPIDGSWRPGDPIERLRALRQVDPANPGAFLPSCDTAMGLAYPPVRIAELVYSFGNDGVLESICRDDWTAALQAITRKIMVKLPGVCVDRPLASTGADTCRVVETLADDRPCPAPADAPGLDRLGGWQLDLGTVERGGRLQRRCEILPADYDGNGCPDGSGSCDEGEFSGGLDGWFYDNAHSLCPFGQVRFTHADVTSDRSDVRFECLTALCPERRQCASAERPLEEGCRPDSESCSPGSCGPDEVCVQQVSEEICGWSYARDAEGQTVDANHDGLSDSRPCACSRCTPTLAARCDFPAGTPAEVMEIPLVGAGGCCAEGFHCENGGCLPDRTTLGCRAQ